MDKGFEVLRRPVKLPLLEGEWRTSGDGTTVEWEDFSLNDAPYASIKVNDEEVGGEDIIHSADDLIEMGEFFIEIGNQLKAAQ